MIQLPIENIINIEDNMLIYKDAKGDTQSIDLLVCADNYRRLQEVFIGEMGLRCVGERFFDKYSFYEFYGSEQVQFFIDVKRALFDGKYGLKPFLHKRKYKKFMKIEQMLNQAGYTTVFIM